MLLAQLNSIELLSDFDRVLLTTAAAATALPALADFLAGDISNDEDKEEEEVVVVVVVSAEDNILRKAEFRFGRFDFTLLSTLLADDDDAAEQRNTAIIQDYHDDQSMHHLTYRW